MSIRDFWYFALSGEVLLWSRIPTNVTTKFCTPTIHLHKTINVTYD